MPRNTRNKINTKYFHVMNQGINKSYVFEEAEDKKYYISTLYKLSKELDIDIFIYCIMNNHSHLLIKAKNVNELSKYMHRLNTKYAKYYNSKHERVGYVFRGRFKSEGIFSLNQFYCCTNYIFNNPVKAGLCSVPSEYSFSNYKKIDKKLEENYVFLDIDEEFKNEYKNLISNFLLKHKIQLSKLRKNQMLLKELVIILKKQNASFREIEKLTNISREKLRKIYVN